MGNACCSGAERPPQLEIKRETTINRTRLRIIHGNIADEQVDIVVNAANINLKHGGEVSGRIIAKGGIDIQRESNNYVRENGIVAPGNIAVTNSGTMSCKKIIHAVGPIWKGGRAQEEENLRRAIFNTLSEAED